MQNLNVTLIQTELHWHNPQANRDHFATLIDGIQVETDLVILPEMFTTGFTMDAEHHAEPMDGPSIAWMADMASRYGCTLCGSLIVAEDGHYYNRLVWMPPDGVVGTYDKRHLFRMADEQEHYTAGRERRIFQLNDWRVCPLVCYDLRFPVWSRGVDEFDLLLYVANWPSTRKSAWQVLLPARAVENLCYSAGVNRVGADGNGRHYSGGSVVVDHLGHTALDCGSGECVATVTLDGGALTRYRQKFPANLDADRFEIR
jgi:predicted amidohydrolase